MKDLELSKQNLPGAVSPESENADERENTVPASQSLEKRVEHHQKVSSL